MGSSKACGSSILVAVAGSLAILLITVAAAPMQATDEEQSENMMVAGDEAHDGDTEWDPVDITALRKLIMQLDSDERFGSVGGRVGRSWPQAEPRGWSLRQLRPLEGRIARPWRADKRQVRFRQCYFNPISCFRK